MINYRRKSQADCHRVMDIVDAKIKHLGYKAYDGRVVVDPVCFAPIMSIRVCKRIDDDKIDAMKERYVLEPSMNDLGFDFKSCNCITEHETDDGFYSIHFLANLSGHYGLQVKDHATLLKELEDALRLNVAYTEEDMEYFSEKVKREKEEIDNDLKYDHAMKYIR